MKMRLHNVITALATTVLLSTGSHALAGGVIIDGKTANDTQVSGSSSGNGTNDTCSSEECQERRRIEKEQKLYLWAAYVFYGHAAQKDADAKASAADEDAGVSGRSHLILGLEDSANAGGCAAAPAPLLMILPGLLVWLCHRRGRRRA